ncbi:hypothetical protein BDV19DRAFT_364678 [Aspergillus venezuelensis]
MGLVLRGGNSIGNLLFERRVGDSQKSQNDSLMQEIGLLMSVSHHSLLCLKDTFDEDDGVYLYSSLPFRERFEFKG